MISYNIEPHDITSLTWPMWDACGIECPAMIGADCPDKPGEGTARCLGWSSKFPSAAAEVVWCWTMQNFQDEDCGGEDGGTWFALFHAPKGESHDGPMGAGVILCTLSSGAVQLTRFTSTEELTRDWAKIVAEYEDNEDEETD